MAFIQNTTDVKHQVYCLVDYVKQEQLQSLEEFNGLKNEIADILTSGGEITSGDAVLPLICERMVSINKLLSDEQQNTLKLFSKKIKTLIPHVNISKDLGDSVFCITKLPIEKILRKGVSVERSKAAILPKAFKGKNLILLRDTYLSDVRPNTFIREVLHLYSKPAETEANIQELDLRTQLLHTILEDYFKNNSTKDESIKKLKLYKFIRTEDSN